MFMTKKYLHALNGRGGITTHFFCQSLCTLLSDSNRHGLLRCQSSAGLDNGTMKEALCHGGKGKEVDTDASCRLTKDGHTIFVTTKGNDVALDPTQGLCL